MAARLIDEHKISEEELGHTKTNIKHTQIGPLRVLWEHRLIGMILQKHFYIRFTFAPGHNGWLRFCGKPDDLIVAERIYIVLLKSFKQRWKEHKTKTSNPNYHSFMCGVYFAVMEKLDAQREARLVKEKNALVIVKKNIDDLIDEYFDEQEFKPEPAEEKKYEYSEWDEWRGRLAGSTINIYEPVPAGH